MNFTEFFVGSGEFAAIARSMGFKTETTDWKQYGATDIVEDAEYLTIDRFKNIPDHVHFGMDCGPYSIAAISTHRNGIEPKSERAKKSDRVNIHCIDLLHQWEIINPGITYSFENPRGMLRHMPFMQEFKRYEVWYCQYGDERAKPTDIWTNLNWTPRPPCRNYKYDKQGNIINKHCHHAGARRGAKTGTQGRKNAYERSRMPKELCVELLTAIINDNTARNIVFGFNAPK